MAGWFVVNVSEARAARHALGATVYGFEEPAERFPQLGINIRVLEPGQAASLYHSETLQEDFLVLSGECLAIIEGEERRLRAWDFVHCPPGTEHVFVGAGDGPAAILMVGARGDDQGVHYPVSEAAARHGASAERETSDPAEAYAPWGGYSPVENRWPPA
jgi:uncharacterized cupin superfamily protein